MENVEMIIRIKKTDYEPLRKFLSDPWVKDKGLPTIAKAFLDGIVLDKDHGRIVDIDVMLNDISTSINEMTSMGVAVDVDYLWAKLNDAISNALIITGRS